MQQKKLNLTSLPSKNSGTGQDSYMRIIEIDQTPAYQRSKHRAAVGAPSTGEQCCQAQTQAVLANVIGAHRLHSNDPVTDCQLSHRHHLITSNFQIVDLQWQGAFQLEQPLADRYIIYIVLAGTLTQKIESRQPLETVLGFPMAETSFDRIDKTTAGNRAQKPEHLRSIHQSVCCNRDTATIVSPGQQLVSIASEEGNALLISIDRDSIDAAVSNLLSDGAALKGQRSLKQPVIFQSSIDLTSELGMSIKKFLQFCWESTQGSEAFATSLFMQKLEQAFLACAIEGLASNYSEELLYQTDGALACHVRKAQAFIESHLHEDIKLGDIAAATSVCSRLLQKAFSHHCGCSPMRFVTQTRLQRIRQDLEGATTDTKIVDVMMHYGFTQGGKFAKEYQQLFGEKPSETLKRCSQFNATRSSSLWQQLDDPRSEGVVGGSNPAYLCQLTTDIQASSGFLAGLRRFFFRSHFHS
jgi:AraC-like DNA-binding protein